MLALNCHNHALSHVGAALPPVRRMETRLHMLSILI